MKTLLIVLATLSLSFALKSYAVEFSFTQTFVDNSTGASFETGPVGSPGNINLHINFTYPNSRPPNNLIIEVLDSSGTKLGSQPAELGNLSIPQTAPSILDINFTLNSASKYILTFANGDLHFNAIEPMEITITVDGVVTGKYATIVKSALVTYLLYL